MDSLSQIVLGSSVAAAITPAEHRRRALLAGGILGTLPDLDSIPLALAKVDPVTMLTWHRGPSHSLFVLTIFGWLLWLAGKRWWQPVREAPRRWLWAIQLALITHPMLDAFTIYGTQLWWPSPAQPIMGGSVFIIDFAYTLPLLIACVFALIRPGKAQQVLVIGLVASTAYLGWSVFAQNRVDRLVHRQLAAQKLEQAPRFITPTPLNTFLWRIVVMTPEGYLEGYHSLIADQKPVQFKPFTSDTQALAQLMNEAPIRRLAWFNRGFMKAEERAGKLVLSDLRMGAEPNYVFRFTVAQRSADGSWQPIPVESARWPSRTNRVAGTWTRIWNEP